MWMIWVTMRNTQNLSRRPTLWNTAPTIRRKTKMEPEVKEIPASAVTLPVAAPTPAPPPVPAPAAAPPVTKATAKQAKPTKKVLVKKGAKKAAPKKAAPKKAAKRATPKKA